MFYTYLLKAKIPNGGLIVLACFRLIPRVSIFAPLNTKFKILLYSVRKTRQIEKTEGYNV